MDNEKTQLNLQKKADYELEQKKVNDKGKKVQPDLIKIMKSEILDI